MSLEAVIAENTSAMRELIAALTGVPIATGQVAAVVEETAGKKSGAGHSSARTRTASDSSASSSTGSTATSAPEKGAKEGNVPPDAGAQTAASTATDTTAQSAQTGDAPTYQQTADAVTKLARVKGRDAAVAVLKDFGAAKLPDVKPDQFAAVVAACNKAMEG